LEAAWERIVAAMLSGDKRSIATAVMCYAYYWCGQCYAFVTV
jgi:hypothetical protein